MISLTCLPKPLWLQKTNRFKQNTLYYYTGYTIIAEIEKKKCLWFLHNIDNKVTLNKTKQVQTEKKLIDQIASFTSLIVILQKKLD